MLHAPVAVLFAVLAVWSCICDGLGLLCFWLCVVQVHAVLACSDWLDNTVLIMTRPLCCAGLCSMLSKGICQVAVPSAARQGVWTQCCRANMQKPMHKYRLAGSSNKAVPFACESISWTTDPCENAAYGANCPCLTQLVGCSCHATA